MPANRWISGELLDGHGHLDPATGILSRPVRYHTATGGTISTHDFHPYGNRHAWRPAVNGNSARPWFVMRDLRPCEAIAPGRSTRADYHNGPTGKLRRFATREAAARVAAKLNA